MPFLPDHGQIVLDEIGLAIGRLGGWILRTSFIPVFQPAANALRPVAVMPGLLVSRDTGTVTPPPIAASQRRAVARLAAELCRINAAHVGAPGLCVIEGFDLAWPQAARSIGKLRPGRAPSQPDEFRRFGRLVPPADPFTPREAADPPDAAPDIVRLDVRLLEATGSSAREMHGLVSACRAEGLDILLTGIADARLLGRGLELGGLLAGPHLAKAQAAGTEIDMTPRALSGLAERADTLVAFRPREQTPIKTPDRRVQNL